MLKCCFFVTPTESNSSEIQATFYFKNGKPVIKTGVLDESNGVAVATYNDTMEQTGWGILNIKSGYGKKKVSDRNIMYAAGFLEGALTSE